MSAFIGLPLAAANFDSGDQTRNMVERVGWGSFVIEHLVSGIILGLLRDILRTRVGAVADTAVHAHQ